MSIRVYTLREICVVKFILNYVSRSDNQENCYFNQIPGYPDLKNLVKDKLIYENWLKHLKFLSV